jgi:hypothetical protein
MSDVTVTYQEHRGYVATLADGSTVVSLSLAGLRNRLPPHARLVLDKRARQERDQRRRGGFGGREQWTRTR